MSTEELKMYLMTQFVLEYRASIDTLSKVFNINYNELYTKLINTKDERIKKALIYVLDYETRQDGLIDQKVAKRKINMFLYKLHSAKSEKEKFEIIKQLNNNSEISKLADKKDNLNSNEIATLIRHRYKYALSRYVIINEFGISERVQRTAESKMDDDMKQKLQVLNSYNKVISQRIK